jgi:hypothetical protein
VSSWLTFLVLAAFNGPILAILVIVPFGDRLASALQEKTVDSSESGATSYSRITGALGAVVLTAFFWSLGNIVLIRALSDVTTIKPMMDAISPFLLVGSALFLPYAVNQLKTLFPWSANAAIARAQIVGATMVGEIGSTATRLIVGNLSSISSPELDKVIAAITLQLNLHFKPEWGVGATLTNRSISLAGAPLQLDAATEAIIYLGDSSQDSRHGVNSAAGYHSQNHQGVPFGFVYLDASDQAGEDWSVTLSHEVMELLADPAANSRVIGPDPRVDGPDPPSVAFELEVCDPTQGDWYPIGGVNVANFVNKSYFGKPGGAAETNFRRLPLRPFSARPRGYAQYHDADGVHSLFGDDVTPGQQEARLLLGRGRRNWRRANRR